MSLGGTDRKAVMTAVMVEIGRRPGNGVAFVLVSALVRFFRTSLAAFGFLFEMYR